MSSLRSRSLSPRRSRSLSPGVRLTPAHLNIRTNTRYHHHRHHQPETFPNDEVTEHDLDSDDEYDVSYGPPRSPIKLSKLHDTIAPSHTMARKMVIMSRYLDHLAKLHLARNISPLQLTPAAGAHTTTTATSSLSSSSPPSSTAATNNTILSSINSTQMDEIDSPPSSPLHLSLPPLSALPSLPSLSLL